MHQSLTVSDLQFSYSTCSWVLKVVYKFLSKFHTREDIVEVSLTMRLEKEDSLTLTFDRVDTNHNESL